MPEEGPIPDELPAFASWCREHGIGSVILGTPDTHGIMRGRKVPLEEFVHAHERGGGIAVSDVMFVLTHAEETEGGEELVRPPKGAAYPRYFPRQEQGFPDVVIRGDLSTAHALPWRSSAAGVIGDATTRSGDAVPIAPREVLRRVVDRVHRL
jgi:glutamine synthetase